MGTVTLAEIEEAAVEAICKVEQVDDCERLVPDGRVATPDWRLTLGDGRVADVEVTTCPDQAEVELFAAVRTKDGSPKEWHSAKLSYRWVVMVDDRDPAFNKTRRPLKKVAKDASAILSKVEEAGGVPDQMARHASTLFDGGNVFFRSSEETIILMGSDGLQIHDGRRSQRLVVCGPPELVGPGEGSVELHPMSIDSSVGRQALVSDVQGAINKKTKKQQMGQASDLKWLAVIVEGLAAFQLKDYFGSGSRYYDHVNAAASSLGRDHLRLFR